MIVPLIVAFVALVAIATPVSIAMGLAAAVAILWGGKAPINAVVTQMVSGMDSFPLMAIPFFILAGELMERAGISEKLVHLAKVMVGHIRGGLGLVVLVGEYLFSGISGSTAADISAIGSLLIAPMERAGYKKGEAVAIISAATAMGILVPPCIFMIVLASMTNQSIGAMFVAGFLPAIVIGLGLGGYIYWKAGRLGIPREARASWGERWRAIGDGVIAMVMPGIIFGAIFGGSPPSPRRPSSRCSTRLCRLAIYKRIAIADLPKIILATPSTPPCMLLIGCHRLFLGHDRGARAAGHRHAGDGRLQFALVLPAPEQYHLRRVRGRPGGAPGDDRLRPGDVPHRHAVRDRPAALWDPDHRVDRDRGVPAAHRGGAFHRLRHREAQHRGLHEVHGPLPRHPVPGAAGDHLRPLVHPSWAEAVPAQADRGRGVPGGDPTSCG
jgi:hypothetical protein